MVHSLPYNASQFSASALPAQPAQIPLLSGDASTDVTSPFAMQPQPKIDTVSISSPFKSPRSASGQASASQQLYDADGNPVHMTHRQQVLMKQAEMPWYKDVGINTAGWVAGGVAAAGISLGAERIPFIQKAMTSDKRAIRWGANLVGYVGKVATEVGVWRWVSGALTQVL